MLARWNYWNRSSGVVSRRSSTMAHRYEIYKDKAGEYRARFKYNSEIMFSTEGYSTKAAALNAIESMKRFAPGAPVESIDDVDDLVERLRRAQIPAADRVVGPDHNSKEFKDFQSAYRKLDKKIRTGNDLVILKLTNLKLQRLRLSRSAHRWTERYSDPLKFGNMP